MKQRRREQMRGFVTVAVAMGLAMPVPPMAWAQLETVDPALYAAVEALVAQDPEVAHNPELVELCRNVAKATVLDPRERAAVTNEVVIMQREGIDASTVIPTAVREAAREEFARVQGQMQEQIETLRATDPERAREMELMMREGEQCMRAFETGEHYVPSPEMVAHADGMFKEWEGEMIANGAPPEFVERARAEFAYWSSGEMHEMMAPGGPGPGHEFGGPGGMPSPEQMERMVASGQMTPEQLQMAKDYMQQGATEHFGPGPGGWESAFTGPGGFEQQGGMEYQGMNPQEAFEHWAGAEGQNFSPEQIEQYREMAEQYRPENQNYDNLQQQQFDQNNLPPPPPGGEVLVAIHDHDNNGQPDEYHYDTNVDGIADHAHPTPH